MQRIAILMALAACEARIDDPERATAGDATSITTAPSETGEGDYGESSTGSGAEGSVSPCDDGLTWTGEACIWPDCVTPSRDACPAVAQCVSTGGALLYDGATMVPGTVCIEPCSETHACKTGLTCREALTLGIPANEMPNGGCVEQCDWFAGAWGPSCGGVGDDSPLACDDVINICVWPEE